MAKKSKQKRSKEPGRESGRVLSVPAAGRIREVRRDVLWYNRRDLRAKP